MYAWAGYDGELYTALTRLLSLSLAIALPLTIRHSGSMAPWLDYALDIGA